MEEYKEKLKIQNITLGLCGTVIGVLSVWSALAEAGILPFFIPVAGDSHWQSQWRGFVSGAAFGILALILFGLAKNSKALKNEKELKKLYIKEHDERTIQIWTAARAAALQTSLIVGLSAIIVSGYFSITVSLTILACVLFTSISAALFKAYYSRKF
ncbi:MAG: hypothetical protein IJE81_02690 [Oscillospiraceae bacterium]|nr:hypothetical protein [Oscillospiraceae bacterium]MBQ7130272.1 hypothetical protein [Oscillospiraceae bacterium]